MQKALLFAIMSLAIVGCGEQSQPDADAPATPPAATIPENWRDAFRGQSINAAFPNLVTTCRGNLETVERTPDGVHVLGWGFNETANDGFAHILSADSATGIINGFGTTIADRPDVPQNRPQVTSAHVGMEVWSTQRTGEIIAYGIDFQARSICRIGHTQL